MDKGFKGVLFDLTGTQHEIAPAKKLPKHTIKFTCDGCGKRILGDARFQDICNCT